MKKHKKTKKKGKVKPQMEGIAKYLPKNEKIKNKYSIGFYNVLTTNERVLFLKKFPKSFNEVLYQDITGIEHYTRILWSELFKAVLFSGLSYYLYSMNQVKDLRGPLDSLIQKYLPELADTIPASTLIDLSIVLFLFYGVIHLLNFIPSLWGYLRITREDHSPIRIHTRFTPQLMTLKNEISELMKSKKKERQVYIAASGEAMPGSDESPADVIADEFEDIAQGGVVVVSSKSKHHMDAVATLLNILVNERGMGGVYISLTRPYEYIVKALDKAETKSSDIYFIDCISQMAGKVPDKTDKNIVFVENPSSLEEVTMYLDRMLSRVTAEKHFLFLDSLSSLLIYNTPKSVKEFTHFIINKMRLEGITGVILSIEKKEANELLETLTPMCDKEIRL